jgi:hypothetical protein
MTPIVDYLADEPVPVQEVTKARKAGKKQRIEEMLKGLVSQPQDAHWLEELKDCPTLVDNQPEAVKHGG